MLYQIRFAAPKQASAIMPVGAGLIRRNFRPCSRDILIGRKISRKTLVKVDIHTATIINAVTNDRAYEIPATIERKCRTWKVIVTCRRGAATQAYGNRRGSSGNVID